MLDNLWKKLDNKNMKNFIISFFSFAIVLFAFSFSGFNATMAEEFENEYICTANFCYLYSSPSFSGEKIKDENNEIIVIKHKDTLKIKLADGKPVEEKDTQNKVFYLIESYGNINFENNAYIFADFVVKNDNDIEIYPAFNASTNQDTHLYLASGEEIVETETFVTSGTRIYLYEGYDESLEFTRVALRVENTLQYGYLKTSTISPDGINPAIIYALTIALACIGIITALLFMKNKKKKSHK